MQEIYKKLPKESSFQFQKLSTSDRAGLLNDVFALARYAVAFDQVHDQVHEYVKNFCLCCCSVSISAAGSLKNIRPRTEPMTFGMLAQCSV